MIPVESGAVSVCGEIPVPEAVVAGAVEVVGAGTDGELDMAGRELVGRMRRAGAGGVGGVSDHLVVGVCVGGGQLHSRGNLTGEDLYRGFSCRRHLRGSFLKNRMERFLDALN